MSDQAWPYPFDEAPKLILKVHNRILLALVHLTLSNMGIKAVRTILSCLSQNEVVKRYSRALTEELLNHIIPLSAQHIKRLLKQYQTEYVIK